jgi:hypothetical protein
MIGSKFHVQSDQISLVVSTTTDPQTQTNTYKVNAASIVAGINNDTGTGQSYVILNADRIYLDADKTLKLGDAFYVSDGKNVWIKRIAQFGNEAGKIVTINGGTINAPTLQVNSGGTLQFSPGSQTGSAISFNHAKAASIITGVKIVGPVDNVYTLQYQSAGTGDTWNNAQVTFSRATTLSGAWSSGAFTVTATPQGDTLTTSLTNTGHWGNPSVTAGEDENTYYFRFPVG